MKKFYIVFKLYLLLFIKRILVEFIIIKKKLNFILYLSLNNRILKLK